MEHLFHFDSKNDYCKDLTNSVTRLLLLLFIYSFKVGKSDEEKFN